MKLKIIILLIFIFPSCGFKAVNQNYLNEYLIQTNITGDKRINYLLRNELRIGNEKGKGDFFNLRRLAISNFLLIFLLDFFFCLLFILAHDFLPWMYFDSSDSVISSEVREVIGLAADLILIAAFFQIADGVQAVVLATLRGMQDVWLPAFLIFLAYGAIGFPISYHLALNTDWEINGIWIGLLTGLSVSALFLIARFQYITKKIIT